MRKTLGLGSTLIALTFALTACTAPAAEPALPEPTAAADFGTCATVVPTESVVTKLGLGLREVAVSSESAYADSVSCLFTDATGATVALIVIGKTTDDEAQALNAPAGSTLQPVAGIGDRAVAADGQDINGELGAVMIAERGDSAVYLAVPRGTVSVVGPLATALLDGLPAQ